MTHDRLLLDLYACPTRPGHWAQVLDRLCDETGAMSAVVQRFHFDGERARLHWQAMDRQTARHQTLPQARYAAAENPRMKRERSLRALNRVVRDDELFDRDDPERQALQRELAVLGIGRFIGMLQPLDDGQSYLAIALHKSLADGGDFDGRAAARLEGLAPHVRQASEIAREVEGAAQRQQALESQLDGLRCGLLACDRDGRLAWANGSARRLLGGRLPLALQQGLLKAQGSAAAAAWRTALRETQTATRFLRLGDGEGALHLALRAGRAGSGGASQAELSVALTPSGQPLDIPDEAWSRLLGVTVAEARLVATLVEGGTLESHAQRRGVSIGTVRGQFKQVLAKTGTHRQADLVRLALSSAAAQVLDLCPRA